MYSRTLEKMDKAIGTWGRGQSSDMGFALVIGVPVIAVILYVIFGT
jgi:hypothetical protein